MWLLALLWGVVPAVPAVALRRRITPAVAQNQPVGLVGTTPELFCVG